MRYLSVFLCALLLVGCSGAPAETTVPTGIPQIETTALPLPTETVPAPDPVEEMLSQMTLEEKVGQIFLARCNRHTALEDIKAFHLGGLVLFSVDFQEQTPDSLRETLADYQSQADIPLLIAVDEEGGTVTRISSHSAFREYPFPSPRDSYAQGGRDQALANEEEKCALLSSLNININLGPVCDISTEYSAFMYQRSLGLDPAATSDFVYRTVQLMDSYHIGSVLKHFPGYGNNADTHTGIARDSRTLEELEQADLQPFAAGIAAGCGGILVSHTIVQAFDDQLPASLSPEVHRYLREEMDFQGVIITDDLVMQAITDAYGAEEAAVMAVLAGNDLLCVSDYAVQYPAVLAAVQDGRISMETLNNAVYRVLQWKWDLGLF